MITLSSCPSACGLHLHVRGIDRVFLSFITRVLVAFHPSFVLSSISVKPGLLVFVSIDVKDVGYVIVRRFLSISKHFHLQLSVEL